MKWNEILSQVSQRAEERKGSLRPAYIIGEWKSGSKIIFTRKANKIVRHFDNTAAAFLSHPE